MSQQVTEDNAADVIVILTKDNVGVSGLVFGDLTVEYRKEGESSFTAKVLGASDLTDIGDGVYSIAFTAGELDTVGTLVVKVQAAAIDQSVTLVTVQAADTAGAGAVSLATCTLTGHVVDVDGKPVSGAAVTAVILGFPSVEQSSAVLTDKRKSVRTDVNGEFFLALVRLADVEIIIPEAHYKRQIVVPNQATAHLFRDIP